jgi:hypothetical protein
MVRQHLMLTEETAYCGSQEAEREKRKKPGFPDPLQDHILSDITSSH